MARKSSKVNCAVFEDRGQDCCENAAKRLTGHWNVHFINSSRRVMLSFQGFDNSLTVRLTYQ